jgi:CRISPR-associated protein Cst2
VKENKDGQMVQKIKSSPDYPPGEFYLGGKLVKDMPEEKRKRLKALGVTLERDPRKLLENVAEIALS